MTDKIISLSVGDKYTVKINEHLITLEIIELGASVKFMATGIGIKDPSQPRILAAPVFAAWLEKKRVNEDG